MPTKTPTYLRRYTDLPALVRLLSDRQITLLDPKTWDDRNDSFYMSLYKERKKFKTVLALCFSQSPETYHHWRVFSNGPAGVCIVFERDAILKALKKPGVSTGRVSYFTLPKAKKKAFRVDKLPYVKRYGFKPEKEYRAVYTSSSDEILAIDIPITLDCIRSVSLSPWMHASLSKATAAAIRRIDGCDRLRVSRSTLISNEQWKALGQKAT
jgi:hypothetical protein